MSGAATFTEGSLMRHIAVMSLTSSVGLMAIFAVDFIDMVFISMLGRAELAAAIGYAGAVLFFTTSFGIGMAIAAGALVARAVGEGDQALARQRASTSLVVGVTLAALFAAAVFSGLRPIVELLGASGETLDLAVRYLSIIVPSMPLLVIGMIGGAILRAHGDARHAMTATLIGGGVNAVLDPLLIFGLGLELDGAALASVAARAAIAATGLVPVFRYHGGLLRPRLPQITADLRPLLAIAFPAVLTQLATPVGQAWVTRAMAEFGEDAVAGMAIVARLTPLGFAVIFALSGAVGPIIGQNAGAGDPARVRRAFREALLFTAGVTMFVAGVLLLLRGVLAQLFEADGLTLTLLFLFCGPLALAFFFNGAIFVANAAFNNLGRPFWSTLVNWGRHTIGTILPVAVGAALFGAPGVLIGQAAGGVVFAAIAVAMAWRLMSGDEISGGTRPVFARRSRRMALLHHRR